MTWSYFAYDFFGIYKIEKIPDQRNVIQLLKNYLPLDVAHML